MMCVNIAGIAVCGERQSWSHFVPAISIPQWEFVIVKVILNTMKRSNVYSHVSSLAAQPIRDAQCDLLSVRLPIKTSAISRHSGHDKGEPNAVKRNRTWCVMAERQSGFCWAGRSPSRMLSAAQLN